MKMATYVIILLCIKVFFQHFHTTAGSAHWVVTEDGKIQSQIDSMLNMRRPYDLVAFMRQEDRSIMLGDLKEELLSRKDEIDKNEERDTVGLEQKFYKTDHDCIAAGKLLPDFDLYISTVLPLENKGIRPEEHIDLTSEPTASPLPPDCSIVTELDYSAHAFEHLEGMKERQTLSGQPELGLRNAIIYQDNVDDYGHRVYEAMKHNKTSWVLYDMAAFYWRIKGDPYHAIECVRRALHFSPRQQKDVALISLANVLHRARYSNEAAIVVHAALDISKELNVNHFTLGNIYAVLGDYNKSVICFENTLKIQPDFEAASKRKYAVLCHAKLENALEDQHRSLQQTLNDLKDYQRKHDYWQQQSEKLLSEQVSSDVKMDQHVAYEQIRLRDASAELGDYCHVVEQEGREVLLCAWNKKGPGIDHSFTSFTEHQDVFPTEHRDMFPQEPSPDNRKRKIKEKNGKPAVDYSQPLRPLKYTKDRLERPKYGGAAAETMADNWPSKDECDSFVQKVPDPRNLSTVYLSPENKGFEVKALLTEAQDLEPEAEHPLPWYPPICVPIMVIPEGNHKTFDHLKSIGFEERTKMTQKLADTSMKQIMLDHVDGIVTEEEVGQRILTALKESIGPSWILYNLAGLYWRIIGNNYHGIECIRRSLYDIPDQYRDVPLVNLATILYRWGRFDDAVVLMKAALSVNDLEPSSHYFFGNVLWATQNYTGAIKHYQTSLDIEPENQEVYNTLRAIKCYQKYHHATQSAAPQDVQTHHVGRNCHPRPSNSNTNDGGHTESRVLCKSEKGEEKCIIETRTRMKASECEGHCTQTCTITPIKIETCGGPELNAEGPIPNFGGDGQCIEKGAALHQNTGSEEGIFGGDFSSKLDEVSENYQKKGLCLGDDCNKLRVQQGGQKPHIKLDFVNGILHQKFIFVQSSNELPVEPHECVIFNDGSKSSGCSQPEFRTYEEKFHEIASVEFIIEDPTILCAVCQQQDGEQREATIPPIVIKEPKGPSVKECTNTNEEKQAVVELWQKNWSEFDMQKELPESELRDTAFHAGGRFHITRPSTEECEKYKYIKFQQFTSTWMSVTAKGINLKKHIDFDMPIRHELEEPRCVREYTSNIHVTSLPGIRNQKQLRYFAETGLKEVMQRLNGEPQPVDVLATRIALALKQNITSWVLANMAALYWRVEGNAVEALACLKLALTMAPAQYRDISLVSVANILHRAGYTNDAIVVTDMALDVSNQIAISHFTLANLYAAKGHWDMSANFYGSTLNLQTTFQPAIHRYKSIICRFIA